MTTVSSRIVTVPNALSFFRLLLIPVFLVFLLTHEYLMALITLVVSSVTDFVDGFVARRFNQVSRVGQLLDPAADRLFIFSTLIGLAWGGFIPWWLDGRDHRARCAAPRDRHRAGQPRLRTAARAPPRQDGHLRAAVRDAGARARRRRSPRSIRSPIPLGWAAALWGVFLYWWAGVIYALEAGRVIRIPRDAPVGASDTVDS